MVDSTGAGETPAAHSPPPRPGTAGATEAAAGHVAPSRETLGGRLRWVAAGEVGEISLGPAEGPRLIGAPGLGAALVSVILEALDRAAGSGMSRVRAGRGEIDVFLDLGGDWPSPSGAPSWVLGGGDESPKDEDRLARSRRLRRLLDEAVGRLGPAALHLVREYPLRRRAFAGQRLRLEGQLLRIDDRVQRVRRSDLVALAGSVAGILGAAFGAASHSAGLLAAGAALFCFCSGIVTMRRMQLPALLRRRSMLEARLGSLAVRADRLDDKVREITAAFGCEDPWEGASRVAEWDGFERVAIAEKTRIRALEQARALAREMGLPEQDFDEVSRSLGPGVTGRGWPMDVASAADSKRRPTLTELLWRTAQLLERIERKLPAPWPILLWEPWADRPPEERARLLMALARVVAPRATVAVVGGPESATGC